ncbi:hypothetical protein Hdeb2414_s0009g00315061 [Helianthus debilis subsp. tardiflorus]
MSPSWRTYNLQLHLHRILPLPATPPYNNLLSSVDIFSGTVSDQPATPLHLHLLHITSTTNTTCNCSSPAATGGGFCEETSGGFGGLEAAAVAGGVGMVGRWRGPAAVAEPVKPYPDVCLMNSMGLFLLIFDQRFFIFCGLSVGIDMLLIDWVGDDEKQNVDFDHDGAARTAEGRFLEPATPLLQPFGYRVI